MWLAAAQSVTAASMTEWDADAKVAKLTFLEWFEANADEIDVPPPPEAIAAGASVSPRQAEGRSADEDDETDGDGGDDTLTYLTSAMLEAKSQRKRAEADVQLLANRLAHLRVEQECANKRIEEANRRTKEVEGAKRRNNFYSNTGTVFLQYKNQVKRHIDHQHKIAKSYCRRNSCAVAPLGAGPPLKIG